MPGHAEGHEPQHLKIIAFPLAAWSYNNLRQPERADHCQNSGRNRYVRALRGKDRPAWRSLFLWNNCPYDSSGGVPLSRIWRSVPVATKMSNGAPTMMRKL